MKLPNHIRDNHERTSYLLHEAKCLGMIMESILSRTSQASDIRDTDDDILRYASSRLQDVNLALERAHDLEWEGFFGKTAAHDYWTEAFGEHFPEDFAEAREQDAAAVAE